MNDQPRFFVDERGGCIAVRDRELTLPDERGLHPETCGVVRFWMGFRDGDGDWFVKEEDRDAAHALSGSLNEGTTQYMPSSEDVEYFKERMSESEDYP